MILFLAAINPHAAQSAPLATLDKNLWCNCQLILQIIKRELISSSYPAKAPLEFECAP